MKKSIMFTMGAMLLMMAGTVMMSCSNDDEVINPEQQKVEEEAAARGSETQLPDASAFIKEITDTGYILSYGDEGVWYVDTPLPEEPGVIYIDGGICYFMYNLPDEFKQERLKVKFSGDMYECKELDKNGDGMETMLAGYKYYDVVIKSIEIME